MKSKGIREAHLGVDASQFCIVLCCDNVVKPTEMSVGEICLFLSNVVAAKSLFYGF